MKRRSDLIVGLTVIGSAVLLLGTTLWVKQADVGEKERRIEARFRDVGNAQVGTPVLIRGVHAGRIERIELADGGWVVMRLTLDPEIALPAEPVVLLSTASLFGEWQATVLGRAGVPANREVLAQVEEADGDPRYLPGALLPDIAQLTAVAGRIAGDVASVAQRVQVAFDDRAARELRASIQDVAELSSALKRTVHVQSRNLDSLARDFRRGMEHVEDASDALRRTAVRIDSSTSGGDMRQIVVDVAAAAADLRAAARNVNGISNDLGRTRATIEQLVARSDTLVVKLNSREGTLGLLVNDPSLYANSDSLVRDLRDLVADVKKNPKKYVNIRVF